MQSKIEGLCNVIDTAVMQSACNSCKPKISICSIYSNSRLPKSFLFINNSPETLVRWYCTSTITGDGDSIVPNTLLGEVSQLNNSAKVSTGISDNSRINDSEKENLCVKGVLSYRDLFES